MQKVVVAIVVVVVVLGGAYYFLMPGGEVKQKPAAQNSPKEQVESSAVEPSVAESKVVLKNFSFSPNALLVKVGIKTTWTNEDVAGHTVTSDTGVFGSKVLSQGKSFEQVFAQKGTFSYHCELHPSMKGTVIVE